MSILGDSDFKFPPRRPLTRHLKDVLESEVDGKYYLSDEQVAGFVRTTEKAKAKGNGFRFEPTEREREREELPIPSLHGQEADKPITSSRSIVDDLYKSRPPRVYNKYAPTLRALKAGGLKVWEK